MAFVGRADLVRLLAAEAADKFIADLTGYHFVPWAAEEKQRAERKSESLTPDDQVAETFQPQISEIDWAPLPFFYASNFQTYTDQPDPNKLKPSEEKAYSMTELTARVPKEVKMPESPELTPWPRLQRRVSELLVEQQSSRRLDVDRLVRDLSRGELPNELPYRRVKRWPRQLNVVVDRSRRLTPFWQDQDKVLSRLRQHIGAKNVREFRVYDELNQPIPIGRARQRNFSIYTRENIPILVLGDCGSLTNYEPLIRNWVNIAFLLGCMGIKMAALMPGPVGRWSPILRHISMASWDVTCKIVRRVDEKKLAEQAQRLLTLCAHAIRVEPGLLRTIRRFLPATLANAGTEADVWAHPDITSGASVALTIASETLEGLQKDFKNLDADLRQKVLQAMQDWRRALPKEIWYEELLTLAPEDKALFPKELIKKAEKDFLKITQAILKPKDALNPDIRAALLSWTKRLRNRTNFNPDLWANTPGLSSNLQKIESLLNAERTVAETAVGYDPRYDGPPGYPRVWNIFQVGEQFTVEEYKPLSPKQKTGSPLALIPSTRDFLHVTTNTETTVLEDAPTFPVYFDPETENLTYEHLKQPNWATTVGNDEYGLWAIISYGGVEQKLRYITPGQFNMGSPEKEVGRWNDEDQHQVTLTQGYWLFDTPVTQALWQAVMGGNPSNFKGEKKPVEEVSWEDCQKFIKKLNRKMPGLDLSLPTEAQWEHACRAGTETATYVGDLQDETKDAILDEIAWYSGNSKRETHPVAQRRPNPWGLYDMLGNVEEWCEDWWDENLGKKPVVDPVNNKGGASRVVRGGGWSSGARGVRAAYRDHDSPGDRYNGIGFRCARVQESMSSGQPVAGGGGADAQAGEGSTGKPGGLDSRSDVSRRNATRDAPASSHHITSPGTKYTIKPGQPASIIIPQGQPLQLQSDQGIFTVGSITKPDWAQAIGRDRYGLWVQFKYVDITQRLRYIPPGQFVMGSPKDEVGRYDRETQHQVTLTRGYWLFDTPVTQALWQAVMNKNPSNSIDLSKPVERVSWNDCKKFIEKLNNELNDLQLTLPTEAQWEHACRAGVEMATYVGDLQDESKDTILDEIAWYYYNSKNETHPVALKKPNPWGLYDMLGNVYEWCEDSWQENLGKEPVIDPLNNKGAGRVVRGGGWSISAQGVRAAYRGHDSPGGRYGNVGFRCARVQEA